MSNFKRNLIGGTLAFTGGYLTFSAVLTLLLIGMGKVVGELQRTAIIMAVLIGVFIIAGSVLSNTIKDMNVKTFSLAVLGCFIGAAIPGTLSQLALVLGSVLWLHLVHYGVNQWIRESDAQETKR